MENDNAILPVAAKRLLFERQGNEGEFMAENNLEEKEAAPCGGIFAESKEGRDPCRPALPCLYETALSAGIPVISADKCARLLAWLYYHGGGNEDVVYNSRLRNALLYAQRRLNAFSGEKPDQELAALTKGFIQSVTDFKSPPDWVWELEGEYKIKPH